MYTVSRRRECYHSTAFGKCARRGKADPRLTAGTGDEGDSVLKSEFICHNFFYLYFCAENTEADDFGVRLLKNSSSRTIKPASCLSETTLPGNCIIVTHFLKWCL
jgi:hypothetical protein